MNYQTAAALSQNLAGIGEAFMQMNDPATRAKAALFGNQNALLAAQVEGQGIENQYRPGLFNAQTFAANANGRESDAGALFRNSQTAGQNIQNMAAQTNYDLANQQPTGTPYTFDGNGVISEETQARIQQGAANYFTNPRADVSKLPLGMRNNNPLNMISTDASYAKRMGAIGASRNEDAGSNNGKGGRYRQLVFDSPVAGMRAASGLIDRKYNSGMKTANQIIAAENGWTGGNFEAAANIARTMGVSPDADLNLGDPATKIKFMRALARQEHGEASNLYTDEVYGGGGGDQPASQAFSQEQVNRIAINSNIQNGGGALDAVKSIAAASGLFATTPAGQDSSLVGQGVAPANAINTANNANKLNQERIEQTGAMDRTVLDNENNTQNELLKAYLGGGGTANGLAPKSFNDAQGATKTATEIANQVFKLQVDPATGQATNDAFAPQRNAYAASINNLILDGKTAIEAKAIADMHHFGGEPAVNPEDGWTSDPVSGFKNAEVIPRQASGGGDRLAGIAQALGFGGQQAPAPAQQPTPVTTQPAAVPQTGVPKPPGKQLGAADAMKKRQVESDEGTAYNVATLKEILPLAQAKGVSVEDMMATLFANSPTEDAAIQKALANSRYGIHPDRIRNALKDSRALSAVGLSPTISQAYTQQPAAQQGGVRRYNPATGTIE